jgi:hypothetical protein
MSLHGDITKAVVRKCRSKQPPTQTLPTTVDETWVESNLPYLPLAVDIPASVILDEIKSSEHLFVEHREEYGQHSGWSSFCIHGKSYDATREDEYYKDDRPYVWTPEAKSLLPNTIEFFKTSWFGSKFKRLRVMKLAPGGFISLHSDNGANKLGPINIAITQPGGCEFVFEKYGTVPFAVGSAIALNVYNNHCVYNNSDQDRYHIIVHQLTSTEEYSKMLVHSAKQYLNENSTNSNQR